MLGGEILHRKSDTWTSMALSLLILLIYNPFLVTSLGVLLSYGGTVGIITLNKQILNILDRVKIKNKKYKYRINKKMQKIIQYIKEALAISISVQLVIIPIIAISYNTIGISFIVTSIILSLIIGPIVLVGLIAILISFISIELLKIISIILIPFLKVLIITSKLGQLIPFSKIYVVTPSIIVIIIYYCCICIFNAIFKVYNTKKIIPFHYRIRNIISLIKYKLKLNKKKFCSIFLIVCIVCYFIIIIPQDLKIHFIDVGQGDSTLIITPKKQTILIDGGGSENSSFDVGKRTLLPYLLDRKINKIDYAIISHFDQDHIGGLLTIMQELEVRQVIISKQMEISDNYNKFKEIVKEKQINVVIVEKGERITIEKNLYIDILWPNNSNFVSENVLNNNSIVLKLSYKNFSMMFTGDIEKIAEKQILKEYSDNLEVLNSKVLKVAHHGSKTSSIDEFIEVVKPKITLIGVGENNNFGHPNDEVITRLENIRS